MDEQSEVLGAGTSSAIHGWIQVQTSLPRSCACLVRDPSPATALLGMGVGQRALSIVLEYE